MVCALAMLRAITSMRTRSAARPVAAARIPAKSCLIPSMAYLPLSIPARMSSKRVPQDRRVGLVEQAVLAQAFISSSRLTLLPSGRAGGQRVDVELGLDHGGVAAVGERLAQQLLEAHDLALKPGVFWLAMLFASTLRALVRGGQEPHQEVGPTESGVHR